MVAMSVASAWIVNIPCWTSTRGSISRAKTNHSASLDAFFLNEGAGLERRISKFTNLWRIRREEMPMVGTHHLLIHHAWFDRPQTSVTVGNVGIILNCEKERDQRTHGPI
jgi:hypothetical protein